MIIQSFEGGYDKNLCYVVSCPQTKIAAIIDPAVEITPILEYIESANLIPSKILITHTHQDHIFYLNHLRDVIPNIEIYCSEKYVKKFNHIITTLSDYEMITVGQEILINIYTPGHYIDSVCFWNQNKNIIFTGDTIFVGRTGRVISSNSNIEHLYNSVYNKIFQLPYETIIYPGHNYGFSKTITIKENIKYSDFFSCKTFEQFKIVMENFESNRK